MVGSQNLSQLGLLPIPKRDNCRDTNFTSTCTLQFPAECLGMQVSTLMKDMLHVREPCPRSDVNTELRGKLCGPRCRSVIAQTAGSMF